MKCRGPGLSLVVPDHLEGDLEAFRVIFGNRDLSYRHVISSRAMAGFLISIPILFVTISLTSKSH